MNFEAPPADNLRAGGAFHLHALNSSIMDLGLENFWAKEVGLTVLAVPPKCAVSDGVELLEFAGDPVANVASKGRAKDAE